MPARILIADDHLSTRTAIRSFLDNHSFVVCGEAKDGKETIEKVAELKPDLVLLDVSMPVMSGIKAAVEIRRIAPAIKIVFFTNHDIPIIVDASRTLGDGFVPKFFADTHLIPTLTHVLGMPLKKSRSAATS